MAGGLALLTSAEEEADPAALSLVAALRTTPSADPYALINAKQSIANQLDRHFYASINAAEGKMSTTIQRLQRNQRRGGDEANRVAAFQAYEVEVQASLVRAARRAGKPEAEFTAMWTPNCLSHLSITTDLDDMATLAANMQKARILATVAEEVDIVVP